MLEMASFATVEVVVWMAMMVSLWHVLTAKLLSLEKKVVRERQLIFDVSPRTLE